MVVRAAICILALGLVVTLWVQHKLTTQEPITIVSGLPTDNEYIISLNRFISAAERQCFHLPPEKWPVPYSWETYQHALNYRAKIMKRQAQATAR